jgi:hypothetical protein
MFSGVWTQSAEQLARLSKDNPDFVRLHYSPAGEPQPVVPRLGWYTKEEAALHLTVRRPRPDAFDENAFLTRMNRLTGKYTLSFRRHDLPVKEEQTNDTVDLQFSFKGDALPEFVESIKKRGGVVHHTLRLADFDSATLAEETWCDVDGHIYLRCDNSTPQQAAIARALEREFECAEVTLNDGHSWLVVTHQKRDGQSLPELQTRLRNMREIRLRSQLPEAETPPLRKPHAPDGEAQPRREVER